MSEPDIVYEKSPSRTPPTSVVPFLADLRAAQAPHGIRDTARGVETAQARLLEPPGTPLAARHRAQEVDPVQLQALELAVDSSTAESTE